MEPMWSRLIVVALGMLWTATATIFHAQGRITMMCHRHNQGLTERRILFSPLLVKELELDQGV